MFLLEIVNKLFFLPNFIFKKYLLYFSHKIEVLEFIQKKIFSFYFNWLTLFIYARFYALKKVNYFILNMYTAIFNCRKLIGYTISINASATNTFININSIKGNPKSFFSAGMFNFKKKQKTKQPKVAITILKTLLSKFKTFKIKPVALRFNNLFPNQQSHILKRLKHKVFIKTVASYNYLPHNGCRLKKVKRIKIRTRTRKLKKE